MDSLINDRMLSLKLTEQQIRNNNYDIEVRKLLGLVIEIGEPEIIFLQLFQQSGDRDTDSKEFDNEPHRWRRNFPQFRKMAAGIS